MPTAAQYWRDRDKCRQRNHKWYLERKHKQAASGPPLPYPSAPRSQREYVSTNRRAVEIRDPMCADSDWISKAEYERNRVDWHRGGRRVFINGVEVVL
jgi:hypothetical protein